MDDASTNAARTAADEASAAAAADTPDEQAVVEATAPETESPASAEGAAGAEDDAAVEEAPLTFEEQVEHLRATLTRNPRFREIEHRVLGLCLTRQPLRVLEDAITAMPEFKTCGQNQYRILVYLEDAGGLERFEVNESGAVVTAEMTEGLTDDEIDDLIADYAFQTTEAGRAVYDGMKPEQRMADLMKLMPARTATYCEVLEFCQQPRAFKEIDALLRGRDILKAGSLNPMTNIPLQPSVFVDNLERCGGIVWDGAWKLTDGGRKYLEVLKSMAS